jgi:hypothetical protein
VKFPKPQDLFAQINAKEPLIVNLFGLGITAAAVYVAPLDDPEIKTYLISLAGAGWAWYTRQKLISPATATAMAAQSSADTAKVLDGAPPGELHQDSIPLVQEVTRRAVESIGGVAGKTAEKVVTRVTDDVVSGVTGRLGRMLRHGK